uniref:RT_RNaseH_2 domain-containing protein n=1 Tax=Strongyloides venezuelensis TaxID=75913 RepID=A0A0K0G4H9_STRVS
MAQGGFVLYTDVSYMGLGAILFQHQPALHIITYLFRSTNSFERNYPSIHLEALAIVWALAQIADHDLFGSSVFVSSVWFQNISRQIGTLPVTSNTVQSHY